MSSRPQPALSRLFLPLPLVLVPIALAAGCDGCPSSKPYTPFTLGSALPAGSAPPLSTPRTAEADGDTPGDAGAPVSAAFAAIAGVPAPGDGKRWPLDASSGAVAVAPASRTFETGLLLDADGDGARDLIAWARAPDGLRGELLFASGQKPQAARTLAALPGDLSAQGCTPRASLSQIGKSTVAFDFAPQCGPQRRAEARRWIAVLRMPGAGAAPGGGAPELALELRVRAPPPEEAIATALEAADRDGDGRDDLTISFGLSGALRGVDVGVRSASASSKIPAELRAPLVFLDRPAGMSRDAAQPGEALRAIAGDLLRDARSVGGRAAGGVAAQALRLRRLHALLCADAGDDAGAGKEASGESIVATGAGPVRCGAAGLTAAIDYAEATAAGTAGAAIAGVAALDRGAAARTKDADKLLAKLAPKAAAIAVRRTTAAPEPSRDGAWSPLAFEASGDLLIRTGGGVVRVDHATFDETSAEVPAWPSAVAAGGAELVGIERRCDAPALLALVKSAPDAAFATEIPLPLLRDQTPRGASPRAPARCSGPERVRFSPLGSSERGIDLAVGAALIAIDLRSAAPAATAVSLPLASPTSPGAARSPDGATIAVSAAGGLLVGTAGGPVRLWSGDDLDKATACVPANGGARVACVAGGAAAVFAVVQVEKGSAPSKAK